MGVMLRHPVPVPSPKDANKQCWSKKTNGICNIIIPRLPRFSSTSSSAFRSVILVERHKCMFVHDDDVDIIEVRGSGTGVPTKNEAT